MRKEKCVLMSVDEQDVICDFYKIILGDIIYGGNTCKDCKYKISKYCPKTKIKRG